ncbi:MAG: hypothetical protein WDM81_00755 [Rhizomicrobium sp.]
MGDAAAHCEPLDLADREGAAGRHCRAQGAADAVQAFIRDYLAAERATPRRLDAISHLRQTLEEERRHALGAASALRHSRGLLEWVVARRIFTY